MSEERAALLSEMMDRLELLIDKSGNLLARRVLEEFLSKLSLEDGNILTDSENFRKLALIDKAWDGFNKSYGQEIITSFITDTETIIAENLKYYREISETAIKSKDIRNIINARLGIDDSGELVKGGYLKGLLDDVSVRNSIKQEAFRNITTGTGYEASRKGMRELIAGNPDKMGSFKQFYRNFTYDTHVQIDRLNGALYAEKLDLRYGIYQGTRRRDSRHFCVERKGKVFSTEEAEGWRDLIGKFITVQGKRGPKKVPIGPIVDKIGKYSADVKADYNPIVDMGGYGCVDTFSFVSDIIAFQLRPDLKK